MKARDRLSTIQAKDIRFQLQQKKKKRKTSLKRRPTFYRTTAAVEDKANAPNEIEVDIGADVVTTTTSATTVESSRSSSMSSKVWVFLHKKHIALTRWRFGLFTVMFLCLHYVYNSQLEKS